MTKLGKLMGMFTDRFVFQLCSPQYSLNNGQEVRFFYFFYFTTDLLLASDQFLFMLHNACDGSRFDSPPISIIVPSTGR